jgi:hypothetical protein
MTYFEVNKYKYFIILFMMKNEIFKFQVGSCWHFTTSTS